jgi:hypothetical protein
MTMAIKAHKTQLAKLTARIQELDAALGRLKTTNNSAELLKIIGQPGWTTPAEIVFAQGLVDAMIFQTALLSQMQSTLLKGCRAVK